MRFVGRKFGIAVTFAFLFALSACGRSPEPEPVPAEPTRVTFVFPSLDPEVNYLRVALAEPDADVGQLATQSTTGLRSASLDLRR